MIQVLVDGDACPVKAEIYKVAERTKVRVVVVANSFIRVPPNPLFRFQHVGDGFDAADDWIAENTAAGTIVVTGDILLADRCLKAGAARVISSTGKPFTDQSIGGAVATRAIMADLRAGVGGKNDDRTGIGGPAPFSQKDRSRFLQALDVAVTQARRL